MMSELKAYSGFKLVRRRGVTAIVINGGRILITKRHWIPFIPHHGFWTFPAGKVERGEKDDAAVYRELREETGLRRTDLELLGRYARVMKVDLKRKDRVYNTLYAFRSKTRRIRLNFENTGYRWVSASDIEDERLYRNVFANKGLILKVIRKALER